MDAEQVVEKILADANAEAQKIMQQAEEKEAAEQTKLNEQLKEYEEQTNTLAQKAAKDRELHILATARMDIAKDNLTEKRKILDEVFDQARRQLQNLPGEDYKKLMTKLMLDAAETGEEEVIIDNREKHIDAEFINRINKQLQFSGKAELKLSAEKQNIGAGFILKRSKIKTNVTIDVLIDRARKDLEIELAKKLFS